jgi:hypothetical protein
LSEFVEPKGGGQNLGPSECSNQRKTDNEEEDSRADPRTEKQRPLNWTCWRRVERIRQAERRRLNPAGRWDDLDRPILVGSPALRCPRATPAVQPAVLGKELVNALPTGNPDVAVPPGLLSPVQLALSKQCANGLLAGSKGFGCLGDRQVVLHRRLRYARTFPRATPPGK